MLFFAICLGGAGAALSVYARFPALVAILLSVVLAVVAGTIYEVVVRDSATSPVWAIAVSVVALQVGYGAGVIVRGGFRSLFRARGGVRSDRDGQRTPPRGNRPQTGAS